jgi:hypothetical protein
MGRPRNPDPYLPRTIAINVKTLLRLDRECKKLKTNRSRFLSGVLEAYLAYLDGKQPTPLPSPESLLPQNRRSKADDSAAEA